MAKMQPGDQYKIINKLDTPNAMAKIASQFITRPLDLQVKPFQNMQGIVEGKSDDVYQSELLTAINKLNNMDMPVHIVVSGHVTAIDDKFKQSVHSKQTFIETIISNEKIYASLNSSNMKTLINDPVNNVDYADPMDFYGTAVNNPRTIGNIISIKPGDEGQGPLNFEFHYMTEDGFLWTQTIDIDPMDEPCSIAVFPAATVNNFPTALMGIAIIPTGEFRPGMMHYVTCLGRADRTSVSVRPIGAGNLVSFINLFKRSV